MTEESLIWQGNSNLGGVGDCGPYSDTEWQRMYKTHLGTGNTNANRGVVRGVNSELQVTANSPTASNVLVTSGAAFVAGIPYYNDSTATLTITANGSGSTRNDIIILRADYVAQTVRLAVVQGTPAAGLPSLVQSIGTIYEIPLAYLTLASGFATVTASMITDYREYSNIPDAVGYTATNSSGGALENGAVVIQTGTQSFTTTTSRAQPVAGVLERRTANGAVGRIITHGIFPVLCDASVSVGDYLSTGTSAGQASISALSFARVLVANTGAGTRALCYVNVAANLVVPACAVYHNANQNIGAAGTLSVAFNSERWDNTAMHDTVTNNSRVTVPVTGLYKLTANIFMTTSTFFSVSIRINGTTVVGYSYTATGSFAQIATAEYSLSAGDYAEVVVFNNTGGGITISASGNYSPEFRVTYIGKVS